jgi:hypothetical protein
MRQHSGSMPQWQFAGASLARRAWPVFRLYLTGGCASPAYLICLENSRPKRAESGSNDGACSSVATNGSDCGTRCRAFKAQHRRPQTPARSKRGGAGQPTRASKSWLMSG